MFRVFVIGREKVLIEWIWWMIDAFAASQALHYCLSLIAMNLPVEGEGNLRAAARCLAAIKYLLTNLAFGLGRFRPVA